MARIFITSNQFSIGFTGISVGQVQTQQAIPATDTSNIAPIPPTSTQTIQNIQETPALEKNEKK